MVKSYSASERPTCWCFHRFTSLVALWSSRRWRWAQYPVVVDFGGPGDIVHPEVGFKVPLTNENDVVLQIEKVLASLARDRGLLDRLRQQACAMRENA